MSLCGIQIVGICHPDPGQVVFLDETSIKTNLAREYGRARRGERLIASVPHRHRKTSVFIGCLHEGGIVAPYVLDGVVFVAYIEQQVVLNLASGDVSIMGNLPVQKAARVLTAFENAGIALLSCHRTAPT